jgi:hypothetical protein
MGARWREDAASESARRLIRIEIVTYGVEATHQGVGTGVISPHSRFVAQQLYGRVSKSVQAGRTHSPMTARGQRERMGAVQETAVPGSVWSGAFARVQRGAHVTREQTASQIAGELCISEATVKRHLANVYAKIGVPSRSEAVRTALIDQWICLHDITTAESSNGSGG